MLAFFVLQPYSDKLDKPEDLFLLDEEAEEKPKMNPERMKELFARWDAKIAKENARKDS